MRRVTAVGVLLFSCSVAFGQVQSMIDQEQPAINNTGFPPAIGGASNQKLAQVFTAGRTGILTHVTVPISCDSKATIVVSIHDVTATGEPGLAVLASETISGSIYPPYIAPYSTVPAAGIRLVEFQPSPKVKTGVQYSIVLKAVGDCSILPALDGDWYSGGHGYFDALPNPPGWLRLATDPSSVSTE